MRRVRLPLGLTCPGCGSALEPIGEESEDVHRLQCPACGRAFKARRRSNPPANSGPPTVGGLDLSVRGALLRMVPPVYHAGVTLGTILLCASGGFVTIVRGWLADRIDGWDGVVKSMGGVQVVSASRDPDHDFGPILKRPDAPSLFEEVAEVARKLGVRPPAEIRLAFLPCCGVVAWRRSSALLLGLPLLQVLTLAELRAILAHELAHLARGDATWAAGSLRFVEGLGRAIDDPEGKSWGPLHLWASLCRKVASSLIGPIARGQEARADRWSASLAGGPAAASALIKVALVQPLFRELLGQHDPDRAGHSNLYATFRALWGRLPESLLESMRLRLLSLDTGDGSSPHPPLPDRIAMVQAFPDRPDPSAEMLPVMTLLGDPEWLEQMLYDSLFGLPMVEPTVFHKAGT